MAAWLAAPAVLAAPWALLASPTAQATPVAYTLHFRTEVPGAASPTGSFRYDDTTGVYADFRLNFKDVAYDLTGAANFIGGHTRLPFELGTLGRNLVDGEGPLGPGLAHWFATPNDFLGFEWRTPAQDYLTFDFPWGGRTAPAFSSRPGVYAGTWNTTLQASPVPAPGSVWLALAGLLLLRAQRRRRG